MGAIASVATQPLGAVLVTQYVNDGASVLPTRHHQSVGLANALDAQGDRV